MEIGTQAKISRNSSLKRASNPPLIAASPEEGLQVNLTRNNYCHFYIATNQLDSRPHSELGALRNFFHWSGFFPIRSTIGPAGEDAAMSHGLCFIYMYVIHRNSPLAVLL